MAFLKYYTFCTLCNTFCARERACVFFCIIYIFYFWPRYGIWCWYSTNQSTDTSFCALRMRFFKVLPQGTASSCNFFNDCVGNPAETQTSIRLASHLVRAPNWRTWIRIPCVWTWTRRSDNVENLLWGTVLYNPITITIEKNWERSYCCKQWSFTYVDCQKKVINLS